MCHTAHCVSFLNSFPLLNNIRISQRARISSQPISRQDYSDSSYQAQVDPGDHFSSTILLRRKRTTSVMRPHRKALCIQTSIWPPHRKTSSRTIPEGVPSCTPNPFLKWKPLYSKVGRTIFLSPRYRVNHRVDETFVPQSPSSGESRCYQMGPKQGPIW